MRRQAEGARRGVPRRIFRLNDGTRIVRAHVKRIFFLRGQTLELALKLSCPSPAPTPVTCVATSLWGSLKSTKYWAFHGMSAEALRRGHLQAEPIACRFQAYWQSVGMKCFTLQVLCEIYIMATVPPPEYCTRYRHGLHVCRHLPFLATPSKPLASRC